jgi:hypothetical protein
MMNARHTPGPWLVERNADGDYSVWTRQPHVGGLATIHVEDINGNYPAEENAQLMAAAPDLLKACQAAIAYDRAIARCGDNPETMASFCTAQGEDLDDLYAAWINASKEAVARALNV